LPAGTLPADAAAQRTSKFDQSPVDVHEDVAGSSPPATPAVDSAPLVRPLDLTDTVSQTIVDRGSVSGVTIQALSQAVVPELAESAVAPRPVNAPVAVRTPPAKPARPVMNSAATVPSAFSLVPVGPQRNTQPRERVPVPVVKSAAASGASAIRIQFEEDPTDSSLALLMALALAAAATGAIVYTWQRKRQP
jgi:hypothetical protein